MSRRYQITAPANQDLEEILRQIAETSSLDRADQFLSRFTQKLRNIASFPNLGKPRKEWGVGRDRQHQTFYISTLSPNNCHTSP